MPIKMVVGLGNPGEKYTLTRHNIGDRVIQEIEGALPGVILLRPQTYGVFMNSCGSIVLKKSTEKGLSPNDVLVVCDDFSIPLKQLRLRLKGSSGGHNGLDSILQSMGTTEIPRLRIGIGPVPLNEDPADFVLQPFARDEKSEITGILMRAASAVIRAVNAGMEIAMNEFNPRVE
jgi:PTH1 family peptidyl-tRNA hydrolase